MAEASRGDCTYYVLRTTFAFHIERHSFHDEAEYGFPWLLSVGLTVILLRGSLLHPGLGNIDRNSAI